MKKELIDKIEEYYNEEIETFINEHPGEFILFVKA